MLIVSIFNTPWGSLKVAHDEQHVHQSHFVENCATKLHTPFCEKINLELTQYFQNPKHRFQLSLNPKGSAFQQQVWNTLLVIPVGRSFTYGELAQRIQTSPRAIGQACKTNPITIFIPCHRVVAKEHIGGYMGEAKALRLKRALLQHEGVLVV